MAPLTFVMRVPRTGEADGSGEDAVREVQASAHTKQGKQIQEEVINCSLSGVFNKKISEVFKQGGFVKVTIEEAEDPTSSTPSAEPSAMGTDRV